MPQISVVIITYNEEKNIGRCLDSVKDVADEIVVLDSFSTDKTKEICESKGVKFFQHYAAGDERIIQHLNGWHFCPMVCYDLRFPVWSRNTYKQENDVLKVEYDVLIYVANWPEIRSYPWKQLLIARAIENQCYVIGVNRIGKDGNDFAYSGDSMVINPRGEIISKIKANHDGIETINLDKAYLEDFRKQFPVGLDADAFDLK